MITENNIKENELSNEKLNQLAPSIFTNSPISSTSQRYSFIPTIDMIDVMRDNGWFPARAQEARVSTKNVEYKGYQKHIVRFWKEGLTHNGHIVEAVCINSHDGKNSFRFMLGVFRLICTNGCIAGDMFEDIQVRHSGTSLEEVSGVALELTNNAPKLISEIDKMGAIFLDKNEKGAFAIGAQTLVYPEENAPYEAGKLLVPRRYYDRKDDLWTTYQVIQENIMKGGIRGVNSTGKRVKTRKIKDIKKDIAINKALFIMAQVLAESVTQ